MAIRGFQSVFGGLRTLFNGAEYVIDQLFATYSKINHDKFASDVTTKQLAQLSTGHTLDAGSTKRILNQVGHSVLANQVIKFTSGANQYVEAHVEAVIASQILLSTELQVAPGADTYSILRYITPTVDLSGNMNIVDGISTVIDNLDAPSLVPTGANLIPRLSNNALLVVANLAANCTRIQSVSDVGEFMNLYLDAARTQFLGHVPLTPDETVDIDIAAGAAVYLGASKDIDIDDATSIIQMNFIG